MSDLFGNHIVGFPTRRLVNFIAELDEKKMLLFFSCTVTQLANSRDLNWAVTTEKCGPKQKKSQILYTAWHF